MVEFEIKKHSYNIYTYDFRDILDKYNGNDEIVTIPDGVEVVGGFSYNEKVKKIIMPDSVIVLKDEAFKNCINLEEIVFSKNLKTVNVGSFSGCNSLKNLIFPDSITKIELGISSLKNLEKLRIPESITEISISFCPKLKEIVLPDKLEKITLNDLESIENIKFSNNIKNLFITKCGSIKNLELPKELLHLSIKDCNNIERINFFDKLKECFIDGCNKLVDLIIPNNVLRLGVKNCNFLENLYIPKVVTELMENSFSGLKNGLNITFGGNLERWKHIIQDREVYEGGPNLNQYHYLGELSWIAYAPQKKIEEVIDKTFEYNLKCEED